MEPHPARVSNSDRQADLAVEVKHEADHEEITKGTQYDVDVHFINNFPEDRRKAIVRKVDWRLPPFLALLYLIAYLDRSNIANAKIEGMLEDLSMTGVQYNVATSIFFVTYVIFEIPSNWILERYFSPKPSLWVGGICTCWGIVMTMHGVVNNYRSLLALRLLMGVFESGFFPAAVLMMNKWYTKFELSARVSIYYAGAAISGAFSGLLAFALAKMDGIGGYEGWRWIFLIEGIGTVVIGVIVILFMIDTPYQSCKWLTEEEREYCKLRLEVQDGGRISQTAGHKFTWKMLFQVLTDWQIWLMGIVFWSNTVPGYGLKFTMPQIIKNMGFESSTAQLMTIPPYFCGAVSAYTFGRLSDKFRRRSYFLLIPQMCLIIGFAILFPLAPKIQDNIGVCFFAVIVVCVGLYPIQPGGSAWISNNLAGPAKRAIGLAWAFSLTNVGAVGGSYIYVASEAPSYPTGFGCSLGFAAAAICAVVLLDVLYKNINDKRDRLDEEQARREYTDEQLAEMGDRSPLFRYIL